MTAPQAITLTVVYAQPITPGLENQGQNYNNNVLNTNAAIKAIVQALSDYTGRPVIRTVNGTEPDASGNLVIPKTVLVEAMTQAQRDALTGADLVIGRLVYNTTTRQLNVYGNSGWQVAGAEASTAFTFSRVATVPTQVVETRPDGSTRTATLYYASDRLSMVRRTNPAQTDTLTYNAAGYLTGITTA